MRDNAVESLFSLFASSDRAEALAGDLAEEREQRGSTWYWRHVVSITFRLWRAAATEAPFSVVALMLAGLALFILPAFGGVAAIRLFPQLVASAVSWIALSFFWWGGALWIGASLVALAPRRGMTACATLAVGAEAALIALGVSVLGQDLQRADFILVYAIGLATAASLLLGGAMARRRVIAWNPALVDSLGGQRTVSE